MDTELDDLRRGETNACDFADDTVPLETKLVMMLYTEWTAANINFERDLHTARRQHDELVKAISFWKNKNFVAKVMKRLKEMAVTDFNPEDLELSLISQLADYYLNHPAAKFDSSKGIKLLEKDIIPIERENYGAVALLADIKIQMQKPKEAIEFIKPALADAISKNFQYNTARLKIMLAKAVIAGGVGPRFIVDPVIPIINDARNALKGCKFWLPKSKYERYNTTLAGLEQQMGVVDDTEEERRNGVSLSLREAEKVEPSYLGSFDIVCANCGEKTVDMPKCSGCGVTSYCSKKCQREAWPDHKRQCKRIQAEKKK